MRRFSLLILQIIPWTRFAFAFAFVVVHRMQCQSKSSQVKSKLCVHPPTQYPAEEPRETRRTGLQLPEVIHWRRLEKSAKQSIEALLELKSRSRHILLDSANYIHIYIFVYCYWILRLYINSIKIIAIESMLKLLERWEGCVEVWKRTSVGKRSHC